jgi:glycosyltransferase involved in cell wall biosynthesis
MTQQDSGDPPRRVSVIVPAYNAEATIDETLHSVRNQTFRDIEIIVVDDGSQDGTSARVEAHMRDDSRIRLLQTPNGGVARARNIGIDAASADLIAPLDADDLWHPEKLARQVKAMDKGGPEVGLVYCWYVVIDEASRIIGYGIRDRHDGNVLRRMSLGNLVGNGSAPLIRKAAIIEAGRYDPQLRDQGAQGCEDLKIYYAIAERWQFAVVPAFLLGYRATQSSMSSDGRRMLRSFDLVMQPVRERHPHYASQIEIGRRHLSEWLLARAISYGSLADVSNMFAELWRQSRRHALAALPKNVKRLRRRFIRRSPRNHFYSPSVLARGEDTA